MENNILEKHLLSFDLSFMGANNKEFTKKQEEVKKIEVLKPICWTSSIEKLEDVLSQSNCLKSMTLNSCSIISNVDAFVKAHLIIVKANNGNSRYLPYLERLEEVCKRLAYVK